MTVLAARAISITDGAIVLAAETVAPRLGLKPEALQAEMQRGQVCCLVETGVDEDEGRTRVTVRYHARSWTLVIGPDGKERATTWSASAFPLSGAHLCSAPVWQHSSRLGPRSYAAASCRNGWLLEAALANEAA